MKGGTGVVAKWLADVDYMIFASRVCRKAAADLG